MCPGVPFRQPRACGIVAGRGGRRPYCGLVRLGPRANGATEADDAKVTDSQAKENTEDTARASGAEGRPEGAVKTSGANQQTFNLHNVLFIGSKLQLIEEMQRDRPVVKG